jgi:hypothetical protein
VVPPAKKGNSKDQILVDAAANGKATSKGKGKAKAEPPPKTSRKAAEPIEVDDVEVIEETEAETVVRPSARTTTTAAKSKKPTSTTTRTAKSAGKELSRLRAKLADVRDFSAVLAIDFYIGTTRCRQKHNAKHYPHNWKSSSKRVTQPQKNHSTTNLCNMKPVSRVSAIAVQ